MSTVGESSDPLVEGCIEDLHSLRATTKRVHGNHCLTEKDFRKIRATINDTIARLQIWATEVDAANIRGRKTIEISLQELQNIIQKADEMLREYNKGRSHRKDDV